MKIYKFCMMQLSAFRLQNSGVHRKKKTIEEVIHNLFGIQAQYLRFASLAVGLRTQGLTYANFMDILVRNDKVILTWGQRATLHLYAYEDWPVVIGFCKQQDNWFRKKLRKGGMDFNEIHNDILLAIGEKDIFSKKDLMNAGISRDFIGPWGDALLELAVRGEICCKCDKSQEKLFLLRERFFVNRSWRDYSKIESLMLITERYFNCYGPATCMDFAHWLGIGVTEAKNIVKCYEDFLICIKYNNQLYYFPKRKLNQLDLVDNIEQEYTLLGKFDPLLLAYSDKSWISDTSYIPKIWRKAGQIEGVILRKYKAVGTWRMSIGAESIHYTVNPFSKISVNQLLIKFREVTDFYGMKKQTIELKNQEE